MDAPRTAWYAAQAGGNLFASLGAIADRAVTGSRRDVPAAADSSHHGTGQRREEVVADALGAGAGWWALCQVLCLHPQAAFDRYAKLRDGTRAPVQQRPHLAVLLTAGDGEPGGPAARAGVRGGAGG